ncbi:uncharacterized protein FIBRA_02766 [Fibroporia radiculosa]|uniref:Uncharacterized protein n=1 Tax=Fibroporia radiculosa TaxID=599839 RepID=J4I986_9APHY|nr:uncharacterized protein FIBRA_02766 [Fibroporia radiculosa]CCM00726.1 predicted protein [Fibroporia radiculosa]
MATHHKITLYDLKSTTINTAWSPHVWINRFILNYKKLPYTTHWVHYADQQDFLASINAPITRASEPRRTLPVIVDDVADGRPPALIADSSLIADYLETCYPEPSIYSGGKEAQASYVATIKKLILLDVASVVAPNAVKLFEGRDLEFYVSSRKRLFGVELSEMFPPEKQTAVWAQLEASFNDLSQFIDSIEHRDPWLFSMLEGPSYADFVVGGILVWFKLAGPADGWSRLEGWNGGRWTRFMANLEPYMQVL